MFYEEKILEVNTITTENSKIQQKKREKESPDISKIESRENVYHTEHFDKDCVLLPAALAAAETKKFAATKKHKMKIVCFKKVS